MQIDRDGAVVLPEPIGAMSATTSRAVAWNCTFLPEAGTHLYTEQQVRALLAIATGLPAQADKQRIDALMHFMQANCYNLELNADETRNILFNLEQIRAWRSGRHDDYVERLYGRKIHSMGGQEQGEGTSTGCAAGGPAPAADLPAVVAPQAQADEKEPTE